jgi:type IV pilus assembly protein PilA
MRTRRHDEAGFTLVELLIVVLIIGMLAAIALPVFVGQSNKAHDAPAKSDLRNAVTHIEACIIDASAASDCVASQIDELPSGVTFVAPVSNAREYMIREASRSGGVFFIETRAGRQLRTCTGTAGGCDDGSW